MDSSKLHVHVLPSLSIGSSVIEWWLATPIPVPGFRPLLQLQLKGRFKVQIVYHTSHSKQFAQIYDYKPALPPPVKEISNANMPLSYQPYASFHHFSIKIIIRFLLTPPRTHCLLPSMYSPSHEPGDISADSSISIVTPDKDKSTCKTTPSKDKDVNSWSTCTPSYLLALKSTKLFKRQFCTFLHFA